MPAVEGAMRSRRMLPILVAAGSALAVSSSQSHDPDGSRSGALAPVEVVASLRGPMGVEIEADGTPLVSDREAGKVYEIAAGRVRARLAGLARPVGLAFDAAGRLLVVEERAGRLLAFEGGAATVLAQGMHTPRWVAVAGDGTIYLSARGLEAAHRHRDDGDDDEPDGRGDAILRLTPAGDLAVWARGFEGLEGVRVHGHTLLAA